MWDRRQVLEVASCGCSGHGGEEGFLDLGVIIILGNIKGSLCVHQKKEDGQRQTRKGGDTRPASRHPPMSYEIDDDIGP